MLLMCDICEHAYSQMIKVPAGYYIEKVDNALLFAVPKGKEAYGNICLNCITGEKELI